MATPEVLPGAVLSFDLSNDSVRELNRRLHLADPVGRVRVLNPGGKHSIAVGLDADYEVEIEGHVGYYCAGMNKRATVRIAGNCGVGVAENMMSGSGRGGGEREPVGRRHRARRPAGDPRRRVGAVRHLFEGRRRGGARVGGTHERVHGPERVPGGVR